MLVLSLFSFVGLSGVQSLSYLFNGAKFTINLNIEEESETKTSEESEVKSEKEVVNYNFVIQEQDHFFATAYHNHLFSLSKHFIEVATPPPEA